MTNLRQNDPFAVSTPVPAGGGANLSPQERQVYEFLWQHRERSPSLSAMLTRRTPGWFLLAAILALPFVALYALRVVFGSATFTEDAALRPYYLAIGAGVIAGVAIRDYGYCKNVKKLWPLEAAVIDFAKVERILWGEPTPPRRPDEPLAAIPVDAHADDER